VATSGMKREQTFTTACLERLSALVIVIEDPAAVGRDFPSPGHPPAGNTYGSERNDGLLRGDFSPVSPSRRSARLHVYRACIHACVHVSGNRTESAVPVTFTPVPLERRLNPA